MRNYSQGTYIPRNPSKYVGDANKITYRSSWEKKVMIYFDMNPGIIKWSSEETVIPYISPVDNRPHRYFVDFTVMYKTASGEIKKSLVEVKPEAQTRPPVKKKKQTKNYINEVMTYAVNTAKWEAAEKWATSHGFTFMKLTERDLGLK